MAVSSQDSERWVRNSIETFVWPFAWLFSFFGMAVLFIVRPLTYISVGFVTGLVSFPLFFEAKSKKTFYRFVSTIAEDTSVILSSILYGIGFVISYVVAWFGMGFVGGLIGKVTAPLLFLGIKPHQFWENRDVGKRLNENIYVFLNFLWKNPINDAAWREENLPVVTSDFVRWVSNYYLGYVRPTYYLVSLLTLPMMMAARYSIHAVVVCVCSPLYLCTKNEYLLALISMFGCAVSYFIVPAVVIFDFCLKAILGFTGGVIGICIGVLTSIFLLFGAKPHRHWEDLTVCDRMINTMKEHIATIFLHERIILFINERPGVVNPPAQAEPVNPIDTIPDKFKQFAKFNPNIAASAAESVPAELRIPFCDREKECGVSSAKIWLAEYKKPHEKLPYDAIEVSRKDVVRSIYGHYYERAQLYQWFATLRKQERATSCPMRNGYLDETLVQGLDEVGFKGIPGSQPAQEVTFEGLPMNYSPTLFSASASVGEEMKLGHTVMQAL